MDADRLCYWKTISESSCPASYQHDGIASQEEESLGLNRCQRIRVWVETAKGFEDINVDLQELLKRGTFLPIIKTEGFVLHGSQ